MVESEVLELCSSEVGSSHVASVLGMETDVDSITCAGGGRVGVGAPRWSDRQQCECSYRIHAFAL